ncbi:hypothetical protein H8356DRAFT_1419259 [Neocallimastix lanati (nom. inval.)]|nr:hypothetical protein H8356DRAFT_1419259 [Neocallimastix sp. JGI-2020a]
MNHTNLMSTKIGGDIGEYKKNNRIKYNVKINDHNSGQPESAEPEGFSNLKKVNNILVYCGKEQVPDVILNEELLMQSITELKDKIKKIIFEEDNFIQITKKEENISKKNPYKDNINILNSGREQFIDPEIFGTFKNYYEKFLIYVNNIRKFAFAIVEQKF